MTRRYFRRLARKLGVSILALACLALPAPITAIADQDSGTGTNSDSISEPTYDDIMTNGTVGPVSKLSQPLSMPDVSGMTLDGLYTHMYGNRYLATTSTTRRTTVVTDMAVTLSAGTYTGKTLTITLPQRTDTTDSTVLPTFTIHPGLSTQILGAAKADGTRQVLADCKADNADNQKLVCTFGSTESPVTVASTVHSVLAIQYTSIHDLTDAQKKLMTPWDFNKSASSSSFTGEQKNSLLEQTPTVSEVTRTESDFDSDISTGAVKQGNVTASDYGANTNTVRWDIYLSKSKLFNGNSTAVIYENAGSASETVNSDGTLKDPKDIQNVDLDYRLRYYPSAEDFTPKVRWTTKAGWTSDSWESLTGCIYRTKDSSGNALSADKAGWHVFNLHGTTNTEGTIGDTCTPYSNNASEPDYTVGVQKGGHGFQIWFNPSSAAVQRMKAQDASDFILEAYYETLPLDVTQRYAKDTDPATGDLRNTDSQWALYNRFRLTYDDSGVTKSKDPVDSATVGDTAATYTNSPTGASTRYDWGEDSWNGTTSSRYPQFAQWLPQYWNSGSNPGIKTATLNLRVIDRAKALANNDIVTDESQLSTKAKELDPLALESGLLTFSNYSTSTGSAEAIKAYDPTNADHTGYQAYENPAWFQLAYSSDPSSGYIPLTGNTDKVTTNVGASGGTTTDAVAPHSGTDGTLSFTALAPGYYRLYPTIAPAGYSIMQTDPDGDGVAKSKYCYQFEVQDTGKIAYHTNTANLTSNTRTIWSIIPYDRIYATVHVASPKLTTNPSKPFSLSETNQGDGDTDLTLNADTTFKAKSSVKGYITRMNAPVISTGMGGQVTTACGGASTDASCFVVKSLSGTDNSTVSLVPWTSDTATTEDAALTADPAYANNSVIENSASVTNRIVTDLTSGNTTAKFSITRADLVKTPNTYSGSSPQNATINTVRILLTPDDVAFKIPVVDAEKMLRTNNSGSSAKFVGNELANVSNATSAQTCGQVRLIFTNNKADSSKTYEASSATGAPIKVAWEDFTDGAGTTSKQCVVSGSLPVGTYTVSEKSSPTAYATTTAFQVALGTPAQNSDNHDSNAGQNVYVAITKQSLSRDLKASPNQMMILGDQYTSTSETDGTNRSDIPKQKDPIAGGTQVFPLQRLTLTVHLYLYDQLTKKAIAKPAIDDAKINVSETGIVQTVQKSFGNSSYISNYAGYAYEEPSTECVTGSLAANEVCVSNVPWLMGNSVQTVKNIKPAAGYTLIGATANSTSQSDQAGLGLASGLVMKSDGSAWSGSEGVDASSSFSYNVTPDVFSRSQNANDLFVNIYEQKLVTSMPMTGAQKAILPIVLAILAVIAAVVMAIAQVLRRKVRGTHIRG